MMDKKEKLLIYPYDEEFTPLLRNRSLQNHFIIKGLAAPNGWGLTSKDAGSIDGGDPINMRISNDFEGILPHCDTVWFVDSYRTLDTRGIVFPRIFSAIEAGKNIMISIALEPPVEKKIKWQCKKHAVYFKHFNRGQETVLDKKPFTTFKQDCETDLKEILTPVIFVLGSGENTQKFMIQLALRNGFLKAGYRVVQIGSRPGCEVMSFHSMPGVMFTNELPEHQKVIFFNHYVKQIEKEEKPDVIIIGIPGGILPFDRKFHNRFGILSFLISQSVEPDVAVFSSVYEDWKAEYFTELALTIQYRFGFHVDCFNLSNAQVDWIGSKQVNMLQINRLKKQIVDEKIKKLGNLDIPVFNSLSKEDSLRMFQFLMGRLEEYAQVGSF